MKMNGKLYHGACFYPELWDEDVLDEDIRMMKRAGINVVRIGEFAWSRMEPEEGRIDVGFFAGVIRKLYDNKIETVMCTPTATPPIWLTHGHPERMHVNEKGETMGHGSRQHACTNHPHFRERARMIIEHIAKELGELPGLIGWQLDNEFKCHVAECMCETCNTLWHKWLEDRYQTIDRLNEAWGTGVWSETYQRFEQVPQPGPTPFLHNSSLRTMYQLFSMDKISEFAREQAEVIRAYSNAPITHNSSVMFGVDHEDLFKSLDFASFDTYASQENSAAFLFNCDLWRNIKKGRPFWVMETSPSYSASLESYAVPHQNGYLKAEAVSSYSLGGAAFCYWLWRQQRAGSEQPHGSVLSAWGEPDVGYENVLEVERARREVEHIMLATAPLQAETAVVYSDRAKVFLNTEPHRGLHYRTLITEFYDRFLKMGIHRDVILEGSPLAGYKLLFTPFIHYLPPAFIKKAEAFAQSGGIWIAGPLTGGRTEHHTIHTDCGLGDLEKCSGVKTLFTFPMDERNSSGTAFGVKAPLSLWSAVFEAGGTKAVGMIEKGPASGKAFITEHKCGNGKIVMLGSMPAGEAGDIMMKKLISHYAEEAGVTQKTDATPGTVVAPRKGADGLVWVVINMDGKGGAVTLDGNGTDLLSDRPVSGRVTLGPHEYRVILFSENK
ncbi:beta-galactosidase [Bacillus haynesii]|uniref:beta-galactosidase n=1 Tax=Bacillus haynesii TaxID=1925021 RepID=UPI00159475A6|nr:beta-galactosidase [Bacillus haynesii]NVB33745.1 beta-galactosidase [Bacillus licheniformis]MCY7777566.1 beta-galactosidase [Bacillus haynesii]MEC0672027.1 beta-galactosidase [Bacillus haynesii]MEC1419140.1 beta-galactosidase [Bacillus haynesii]MEC1468694.1 beta-galactosidase [Bacillus haynesii]